MLYGGVATLSASTNCTGTLIETGVDEAPAYLLTNGHCVGADNLTANSTLVDGEGGGTARFFNTLDAEDATVLSVPIARYEYGTMRGRDVGVVRLDATLGSLRDAGAVPLPITATAAVEGTAVVNIASPVVGIDVDEQVLRRGDCTIGATVDLIEHKWLWLDATRNDCPGVLGGSSGSPLIADGEIVSVTNTTNGGVPPELGDTCYLGKPCEVSGPTATFVPDTSYGVDIAGIGSCFVNGMFTLGDACPLPGTTLDTVNGGGIFNLDGVDETGAAAELEIPGGTGEVAVLQGLTIGDGRTCTDPSAYDDAELVGQSAEATRLPVSLPQDDGFSLVFAAVPGREASAARFVFHSAVWARRPRRGWPSVTWATAVSMVDPLFEIPDIAKIHVLYGPPAATDCSDREAFVPYRRQSFFIESAELPVRFCAVGFDMAGNESPVREQLLEKP